MESKTLKYHNQVKHNAFQGEAIASISIGYSDSAALTTTGHLFMWPSNDERVPEVINNFFRLRQGESIEKVTIGFHHHAMITSKGRLFMWGNDFEGRLGNGLVKNTTKLSVNITRHFNLAKDEIIIQTSVSLGHSSALTSHGRLFLWGENRNGELGDGTTNDSSYPVDITSNFSFNNNETIKLIRVAQARSAVLTSANRLFIWGDDRDGSKPVDITLSLNLDDSETIIDINVELWTLYVLTSFGRLLDVIYRYEGSREIKTIEYLNEKFSLLEGEKISQISMKRFHRGVLTTMNRVFMWGRNDSGELGDGTREYQENPIEITDRFKLLEDESIIEISLGNAHSSALTSSGRLFMWGENEDGELGDGGYKRRLTPVDITSGNNNRR